MYRGKFEALEHPGAVHLEHLDASFTVTKAPWYSLRAGYALISASLLLISMALREEKGSLQSDTEVHVTHQRNPKASWPRGGWLPREWFPFP
jgi:hypothetical protein